MLKIALVTLLASASMLAMPGVSSATQPHPPAQPTMKLGNEILFEKKLDLIKGKRVGLITNPTGLDSKLNSIIERFQNTPGVKLVSLYGPEHGVRGNAQAGEYVQFYFDEQYKLPVFSLYGQSHKPPADMMTNIDEYMRTFDTQHTGKQLEGDMKQAVDVMVFDLQDVGTRVYTYIATMAYAMQSCAESGIPFIVLDRPNPIGGAGMDGSMLEYPKYSSFIGLYPIPLQHGMTAGELAQLFNDKFLTNKVKLTVVPMENWRRNQWFDETGLPWVLPSPNLPTPEATTAYPGQVILEGTNLSEGRGTTKPFEFFGAPWIDGYTLARELNAVKIPGVRFREVWFTPTFSKFKGERCGGCQLHVTDRAAYRSISTTLQLLQTVKKLYGAKLELHDRYFDKVMGTSSVREALLRDEPVDKIVASWKPGLDEFAKLRQPYLLYR